MGVNDDPYDMNRAFTPEQSRSQIWTLLASVDLHHKYMDTIIAAGVDFHAFCNLAREDMRQIGITNYTDQDRLIEVSLPMAAMYRELYCYKVSWNQITNNIKESSDVLAGSLREMSRVLKKFPVLHQSLVDNDTPSCRAALTLIDLLQSRIDLMDRDLKQLLRKVDGVDKADTKNSCYKICGLLTLAAVSAVWCYKRYLRH